MTPSRDALGDISPKQELSIREATVQVCVWEGAVRSSKTIAQILRFLIALPKARGGRIVILGRTREAVYRNILEPMMDPALFGEVAQHVHATLGAPTATILGRVVHIIGANDKQAEDKIRGMTVALCLVDEITILPEGAFKMMLSRLTAPGAQLLGSTNPDSPGHWLKREYLDRLDVLPNWRSWHFTLDDNIALSDEIKANLKANYTGLWYRRFIDGEWVAAHGAIYDSWDPKTHQIAWEDLPDMERILAVGVDYGTTNATSAIMLGIGPHPDDPHRRALYLMDEWRYDAATTTARLTDQMLSEQMLHWLHRTNHHPSEPAKTRTVVVDPAAASFRQQLHVDQQPTEAADNDVLYGIRTVASLIGAGQLFSTDRTPGWNREVGGYSWDDKATAKGEDKPVKVADHSLDAGRYAIVTTEALWRTRINLSI